jgi:hypothetical protein
MAVGTPSDANSNGHWRMLACGAFLCREAPMVAQGSSDWTAIAVRGRTSGREAGDLN